MGASFDPYRNEYPVWVAAAPALTGVARGDLFTQTLCPSAAAKASKLLDVLSGIDVVDNGRGWLRSRDRPTSEQAGAWRR